jgi:hypothetical protein
MTIDEIFGQGSRKQNANTSRRPSRGIETADAAIGSDEVESKVSSPVCSRNSIKGPYDYDAAASKFLQAFLFHPIIYKDFLVPVAFS